MPDTLVLLILMFVIYGVLIYFMSVRPQKKERKKMQEMLDALEVGDSVETTSGFFGVVIDINGDILIVEFGGDRRCRIPMKKEAVISIEKAKQSV